MGGQNHQPTGSYFDLSVDFSDHVSGLMVQVGETNRLIEGLIRAEMGNSSSLSRTARLAEAARLADEAGRHAEMAAAKLGEILARMAQLDYQANPVKELEVEEVEKVLVRLGMLRPKDDAWARVVAILEEGGYAALFTSYERDLIEIAKLSRDLSEFLRMEPTDDAFWERVEAHRSSFRETYSRVLARVLDLVARVHASSLLSTELHFQQKRYPGFGRLGELPAATPEAAAFASVRSS